MLPDVPAYPSAYLVLAIDQTAHNLYLCFDLCTGGELFDRICAKGNYYEEYAPMPRPSC